MIKAKEEENFNSKIEYFIHRYNKEKEHELNLDVVMLVNEKKIQNMGVLSKTSSPEGVKENSIDKK